MELPWRRHGAGLHALVAFVSVILFLVGRTAAYPPPLELGDDAVHEAEVRVVSSRRGK